MAFFVFKQWDIKTIMRKKQLLSQEKLSLQEHETEFKKQKKLLLRELCVIETHKILKARDPYSFNILFKQALIARVQLVIKTAEYMAALGCYASL